MSHSHRRKEVTKDLHNLNLIAKLMVLPCQIQFNQAIASTAKAILMRISAEQVPSLHRPAPRYFKLVSSCNIWPFIISALMSLMLSTFTVMHSYSKRSVSLIPDSECCVRGLGNECSSEETSRSEVPQMRKLKSLLMRIQKRFLLLRLE